MLKALGVVALALAAIVASEAYSSSTQDFTCNGAASRDGGSVPETIHFRVELSGWLTRAVQGGDLGSAWIELESGSLFLYFDVRDGATGWFIADQKGEPMEVMYSSLSRKLSATYGGWIFEGQCAPVAN